MKRLAPLLFLLLIGHAHSADLVIRRANGSQTNVTPSGLSISDAGVVTGISLTTAVTGTLPVANGGTGITSLGTGVATALGVNVGSAGAFVTYNGDAGTPSSIVLTNGANLPVLGISGLGAGVAAVLQIASTLTGGIAVVGSDATFGSVTTTGVIELQHASQNTLTASGGVLSIEGKTVLDQTNTLSGITNKTFVAPVLGAATGTSLALGGSGAASTAALSVTGVPFAGTGTTSFPLLYINDANATASTTLNTAGTYFGVNGDGTQDLMNLLKDGTSQFKVSSTGAATGTSLALGGATIGSNALAVTGKIVNDTSGGLYFADTSHMGWIPNGTNYSIQLASGANSYFSFDLNAIRGRAATFIGFVSGTNPDVATDTNVNRIAAGVLGIGTSAGASRTGWHQWAGEAYIDANGTNATATMASTGLSVTLTAARKYGFKCVLFLANSVAAEGVNVDFDGGAATATNFRAHATLFDTALLLSTQVSALATDITVATCTGDAMMVIEGSITVNAGGTFIPRYCENSHATGTLTIYRGSHLLVWDMP